MGEAFKGDEELELIVGDSNGKVPELALEITRSTRATTLLAREDWLEASGVNVRRMERWGRRIGDAPHEPGRSSSSIAGARAPELTAAQRRPTCTCGAGLENRLLAGSSARETACRRARWGLRFDSSATPPARLRTLQLLVLDLVLLSAPPVHPVAEELLLLLMLKAALASLPPPYRPLATLLKHSSSSPNSLDSSTSWSSRRGAASA